MRAAAAIAAALTLAIALPAPARAAPPVAGGTSFNDAPLIGLRPYSDAVETGGAAFYSFRVPRGRVPGVTVALDTSALDPSVTGAANLTVRMYDPLRQQVGQAQNLGPGDPTTHVKTVTLDAPAAAATGPYYLSIAVNDFLPANSPPASLPVTVSPAVSTLRHAGALSVEESSSGVSWAGFAAFCAAGLALGIAGGLLARRVASARQ